MDVFSSHNATCGYRIPSSLTLQRDIADRDARRNGKHIIIDDKGKVDATPDNVNHHVPDAFRDTTQRRVTQTRP